MAATKGFMGAMKEFFGLKDVTDDDGTIRKQTLSEFSAEVKEIPYKDKMEYHEMLAGVGVECKEPLPPKE